MERTNFLIFKNRYCHFSSLGLKEVEKECRSLKIPFHVLRGEAKDVLVDFVKTNNVGAVVTDFSPLRVPMGWVKDVQKALPEGVFFCRADAHNVVPAWIASTEMETAAFKMRAKLEPKLPTYLTEFPPVIPHPVASSIKAQVVQKCFVLKFSVNVS
jgi:deoxyribodipyrimidine photo-lyase